MSLKFPTDRSTGRIKDATWNLHVRTNNGVTTTFLVNVENELTSVGGVGCSYDNNGNITSEGTRSFSYNDENQLTSVSSGTSYRYDFVYDGMARLRKKLTYIWSSGTWSLYQETRYLYHGRNVIQERDGSDFPLVAYTRGWDLSGSFEDAGGIGGMLARSHNYSAGSWTAHNGYHADGNGNITAMTSTAQAISASYKYDPFGNLISSSGGMAGANAYRFSSKMMEVSSGLYYYGYRFYHPTLQRWLNQDPLSEEGGINLYTFVYNNPIKDIDPTGCATFGDCLKSCASDQLGLGALRDVGAGILAGLGLPTEPKRFRTPGSSPGTSRLSKDMGRRFPQKFATPKWAPTFKHPLARTVKVGRFLGRWLPGVGWGILAYDGLMIANCTRNCMNE